MNGRKVLSVLTMLNLFYPAFNHVLDADWGFAGAQPQSGQHHVRPLLIMKKTQKFIGGIRAETWNATFPFAKIFISPEAVEVRSLGRKYIFRENA